ncbi:efflux RND transporter periplasmic adaptor subunit [Variovorax sp.]|uniref:efflux RND transporter periplasmic adaptor subunit n=1 Tax=Variovorax sp. TaxID=1871043 RepID=UPI002D4E6540|nr:efflux RND transporter periplasmic adaptor subunit [Variovorax sp.]HYP86465.1 efflux RND transporter periplasmic adaptor subunit [Variovorax sp.]
MSTTRRFHIRPVVLVIVLAVLAAAVALFLLRKPQAPGDGAPGKADGQKAASQQRPALTVSVAPPEDAELTITLPANGNIAAWQEASIGSESSGLRLSEVRVNVGDRVRKGQVLATFAPESVNADLAQAKASLVEAQATAADAAATAKRARTLDATGALSQQQINQYLTSEQTAKARVEAAKAALVAQQVRVGNTRVLAPDDGVISARTATVGSVVQAGTELFRLIRQGRLEWRAEVTASELGRLNVGTPAVVTGASGAQARGTVRSVAPTVDPQTRNALVYVDLPGLLQADAAPASLKAGMFASGVFELGRSRAVTVPQQSIVPRDGFNNVLVLQPDQRVRLLKVETGRRVGDRVEVTTPLPAGAQVVVQGAGFLNDGDLVRVVEPTASAPAAAAGSTPPAAPQAPAKPAAAPAAKSN